MPCSGGWSRWGGWCCRWRAGRRAEWGGRRGRGHGDGRAERGVTAPAAPSSEAVGATTGDLVPPLVAAGAAGALAAYGYGRRRRRVTTRTTPGGSGHHLISLPELDSRTRELLVGLDDCVRASAEELGCAADRAAPGAVTPYAEALAYAEAELRAAFRLRQRLDDAETAPDGDDRRDVLEEIVARCEDAGRRLDAAAPGFDQLRALERETPAAVERAETRFRELAGRTPATEAALAALHERYAPGASLPVAGDVEQAKDRLVFAGLRLNLARQCADRGEATKAAASLRAAEAAVAQAGVLLDGVDRLADELATAAARLPHGSRVGGDHFRRGPRPCDGHRGDRSLPPRRRRTARPGRGAPRGRTPGDGVRALRSAGRAAPGGGGGRAALRGGQGRGSGPARRRAARRLAARSPRPRASSARTEEPSAARPERGWRRRNACSAPVPPPRRPYGGPVNSPRRHGGSPNRTYARTAVP